MSRLFACAALALCVGCHNEVPILNYHWLGNDLTAPQMMEPDRFQQEMDKLQAMGFTTIGLDQLYDYFDGKGSLPRRPVLLTFDDGAQSVYQIAYPILRERGMKATLFVITDVLADRPEDRVTWESGGGPLPMLLWSEVREMSESGVFDIGSHTRTHKGLTYLPEDQAREEIAGSKQILEQRLAHPVPYLAYPGHNHNAAVMDLVQQAGYRGAVDGANRVGSRYGLFRMSIPRGSPMDGFLRALSVNWADGYSEPGSAR